MDNNIKIFREITTAGIFLSLVFLFIIIQIPIPATFFKLDFSISILLLSLKYTKLIYSYLIATISPFILFFVGGEIIGILFLVFLNLITITFHIIFEKKIFKLSNNKKFLIFNYILLVGLIIIIISFINLFIFTPAYYNFDYEFIFDNFWYFFAITFSFNLFKISLNYIFYLLLLNNFVDFK
ncbi:ECF transporter S component [Candidatus Hepatoplasma crinochetorum]|uniref:ECF transporter S component n=1 Tax=Candidatus Hepatoplasma crinochetorum TaxID=295596 RepID=UPI003084EBEE|nr:MAG: hypothetical protein HCTKY_0740 [Candidatus Hepatoplasma crinochetorum]